MARLFTVPLGATAREKFIEEIKALPPGAKPVLVLPNVSLLRKVQQETGLRCLSFDFLANRILNMNGYVSLKALKPRQQELIIEDMIHSLQETGAFKYFTSLSKSAGFVKAMTALIGEISKTGLTELEVNNILKDFRQDSTWALKDQDIALLYNFYRKYLLEHDWFDLAGKYRLAAYVLEGGDKGETPRLDITHVYFTDYSSLDPLQLQLLKALSKHAEVSIALTYEPSRSHIFGPGQATYNELLLWCSEQRLELERQGAPDCQYFTAMFGTSVVPRSLEDDQALQVYQFSNEENEVKFVLGRVKQLLLDGVRPEDIVITMRDRSLVAGMAEQADILGIPLALPRSAALAIQPLNEFLELLWKSSLGGHGGAESYLDLLKSGIGSFLWGNLGSTVLKLRKEHFFYSLQEVRDCLELEANEHLTLVDAFLDKLQGEDTVQEYAESTVSFLEALQLHRTLGALHAQGLIGLEELQGALLTEQQLLENVKLLLEDYTVCSLAETKITLEAWLELWHEALGEQEIAIGINRCSGVRIQPVTALQGTTTPYVFLMGMQERRFPELQHESWIYSDKERAALTSMDLKLATTAEGYGRELFYFAAALGLVGQALVITYYENDDETVSPYVDQLLNLFTDIKINRPLPVRPVRPARARGEVQQKDCIIINQDKLPHSFSASSLEIYAKCPFQYLGTELWRLDAYEPRQESIDAVTEGNMLHRVLEVFLGKYLGKRLTDYPYEELWQELCGDFTAVEQDLIAQEALYDVVSWQAERSRVLGLLSRWLCFTMNEQSFWAGFTPSAAEWSFGYGKVPGLSLQLSDGRQVQLRGKVDRLDSNGKQVVVTDYKRSSGSVPSGREQKAGFDLQLPLYMLAVARLLHKQVSSGNYLVLKDCKRTGAITYAETGNPFLDVGLERNQPLNSKNNAREDFLAENWQQFEEFCIQLLTKYIENIHAGYFPVRPAGSACRFCPLGDICRKNIGRLQEEEVSS